MIAPPTIVTSAARPLKRGQTTPRKMTTTIGGVIFRLFGRLPKIGERVTYESYSFTVLEVERQRISRLRVSKTDAQLEDNEHEAVAEEPDAGTAAEQEGSTGEISPDIAEKDQVARNQTTHNGNEGKGDGMAG